MVRGAFKAFTHRHTFREHAPGTLMVDHFNDTSPLGPLAVLAHKLFLEGYMRALLFERTEALKQFAEAEANRGA